MGGAAVVAPLDVVVQDNEAYPVKLRHCNRIRQSERRINLCWNATRMFRRNLATQRGNLRMP